MSVGPSFFHPCSSGSTSFRRQNRSGLPQRRRQPDGAEGIEVLADVRRVAVDHIAPRRILASTEHAADDRRHGSAGPGLACQRDVFVAGATFQLDGGDQAWPSSSTIRSSSVYGVPARAAAIFVLGEHDIAGEVSLQQATNLSPTTFIADASSSSTPIEASFKPTSPSTGSPQHARRRC